jgi:hypothetical protein
MRRPVHADVKRLVLFALSAALLALPAAAVAGWRPPETLSIGSPRYVEDVTVAGNSRGDAVAAWQGRSSVAFAYAHRGGPFGGVHEIPGGHGGSAPRVAIDEQGNALVAWSYFDGTDPARPSQRDDGCCFGVRVNVRNAATGRFRRAQTLTPKGHDLSTPAVAIRRGQVALAWTQDANANVYARAAPRGHRLGRAVHVHGGREALDVALLKDGPFVTYLGNGSRSVRVHEFRVRHGRAAHKRTLSRRLSVYADASVATNASGAQAVAVSAGFGARSPIYAGVRAPGGRFRMRRVARGSLPSSPRVAIARSGAALVGWNLYAGKIFTASRRPGKQFGAARQFGRTHAGDLISGLQIAVDRLGRGVVGWVQSRTVSSGRAHAAFRSRAAGRALQSRDLGPADTMGSEGKAALDEHGRARLIWRKGAAVVAGRGRFP